MKLIGIAGPARSGKDTLAKELTKLLPNPKIVRFVDPVYRAVEEFVWLLRPLGLDCRLIEIMDGFLIPCIHSPCEETKAKAREVFKTAQFKLGVKEVSGRDLLIEVGTTLGREGVLGTLAERYGLVSNRNQMWLETLELSLSDASYVNTTHVILPDLRFTNEAYWLKDKEGTIIYLESENADKTIGALAEQELTEVKKLANLVLNIPKIQGEELRSDYFSIQAKQLMEELSI